MRMKINKRATSFSKQRQWTPKTFSIDEDFGCQTNAERLVKANPRLKFQVGRTRIIGDKKWGDHAWCINPKGEIIDPYFMWKFSKDDKWRDIEYVVDDSVFDSIYS